jgi:hypothetical protein
MTDPSSHQRGRYKITNRNYLKENLKEKEKLVVVPDGRLTPRWTGRLTVGRNVTLDVQSVPSAPVLLLTHVWVNILSRVLGFVSASCTVFSRLRHLRRFTTEKSTSNISSLYGEYFTNVWNSWLCMFSTWSRAVSCHVRDVVYDCVTTMRKTRATLVLELVTSLLGCFTSSLTRGKDPGLPPS